MQNLSRLLIPLLIVAFSASVFACGEPDPEDNDQDDDDETVTLSISVSDQTLDEDEADVVTIDEAEIDEPGFAVIHEDDDGEPGDVIGASDLIEEGTTSDFDAALDRDAEDDETLHAMLHYDEAGTEEYDGDDQPPVTDEDGDHVTDSFVVTIDEEVVDPDDPSITVSDQVLDEDAADVVTIDEAYIDEPGFAVIHEDDDGAPGAVIGASDLIDGEASDFDAELDRDAEDDELLYAMLHYDEAGTEEYDGDDQPPVLDEDDNPVMDDFTITIDVEEPPVEVDAISADNQTLDGADGDLSTIVTVSHVGVEQEDGGFAVIHEGACDDDGDIIGVSELVEGSESDLEVELEQPAADLGDAEDLCAMLHLDDGNGTFDAGDDAPAEDDDEDIIEETFTVTVTDATPAIRITIGSDSATAYTNEGVEPSLFDDDIDVEGDDDDLVFHLRNDWRYEFDNTVTGAHPFNFLNDNGDILLSQVAEEGDDDLEDAVDWSADGDTFQFTANDDFRTDTGVAPVLDDDQITQYECNNHPGMTGPVEYID